ncbi:hypothetical protein DO72_5888 [Burkholderia pseudomallei]|nr:hypothetical protein DO72_5888 [Burkholderia pseudomallei]
MHVDRRGHEARQPPVRVDVRREDRHQRGRVLLQPGEIAAEHRRHVAARADEEIAPGLDVDDALMNVHRRAGLALHRLCHEGGVHVVAQRRLAHRALEQEHLVGER